MPSSPSQTYALHTPFWGDSGDSQLEIRLDSLIQKSSEVVASFNMLQHRLFGISQGSAVDNQAGIRDEEWPHHKVGTGKKGTNFNMYFVSDAHTCGNCPHMFKLPDLSSLQTCVCNCWYNFLGTWHCYTLPFAEAIWWLLPLGWRWLSVASASGR